MAATGDISGQPESRTHFVRLVCDAKCSCTNVHPHKLDSVNYSVVLTTCTNFKIYLVILPHEKKTNNITALPYADNNTKQHKKDFVFLIYKNSE